MSQAEPEVDIEQKTSMGSKIASEKYGPKEAKVAVNKNKISPTKDEVFYVESLLEKHDSKYFVKWENYPKSYNSWEPRLGLPEYIVKVESCPILL